jgi:hypothetical protein
MPAPAQKQAPRRPGSRLRSASSKAAACGMQVEAKVGERRKATPSRPGLQVRFGDCPGLTALGATFATEVRQRTDGRPVGVLSDRRPQLGLSRFVGRLRGVSGRLGAPENPPKRPWHPYFASPRLLPVVRHVAAPFGSPDRTSATSRCNGASLGTASRRHMRNSAIANRDAADDPLPPPLPGRVSYSSRQQRHSTGVRPVAVPRGLVEQPITHRDLRPARGSAAS